MKFLSDGDAVAAMQAMVRWLLVMVTLVEEKIQGAGFTIVEKFMYVTTEGIHIPVLKIKREENGFEGEFTFRNMLDDFLFMDRESPLLEFDWRLTDPRFARQLLHDYVAARVDLLAALSKANGDPEETEKVLREFGSQFKRITAWRKDASR